MSRTLTLPLLVALTACTSSDRDLEAVRLADLFDPATVSRSPSAERAPSEPMEWRYLPHGPGIAELRVDGERLTGRTVDAAPFVVIETASGEPAAPDDVLHHVEVRLRASMGESFAIRFETEEVEPDRLPNRGLWPLRASLVPGGELQSYVVSPSRRVQRSSMRYTLLSPTDASGADIEIASLRFVFRRDHLASIPSGVSWQGVREVYRETIVTRSPERVQFDLRLPQRPRLELALATIDEGPVTFHVELGERGSEEVTGLVSRTLTTPHRWEELSVPLDGLDGRDVTLSLRTEASEGAIGFWGAPVLRERSPEAPGVILFVADTLRRDRLSLYGHERETAPVLSGLAEDGALFLDNQSQATWTKVSMSSVLTSLYPTTHGVVDFPDRVPASATTIAEAFREAGYATIAFSANTFVGRATNLHQGFEVFYEESSVPASEKAGRAYLDRLLPWLDAHRDVPFFALVHVTDPHWPYPAYPPYDTLWAEPEERDRHDARVEKVRDEIEWPLMRSRGLPSKAELRSAGVDWRAFVEPELDWYDGSIRALDAEIGRLVEALSHQDRSTRTLLAFTSDHGEEFLEHGNHWHGMNAYGENSNVPLVLWGPGRVSAGTLVSETVQNIDIMPTLIELSAIQIPEGLQGQSLVPLLDASAGRRWRRRPAVVERRKNSGALAHTPDAYALVAEGFRLVQKIDAHGGTTYELYDHAADPLSQENVASEHPEVVERLARQLEDWRRFASAARLPTDEEVASTMSSEQLERLRSLGYVQ